MPSFENFANFVDLDVHPFSKNGIQDKYLPLAGSTPVSTAFPATANLAYIVPVWLGYIFQPLTWYWLNGATITGTIHMDIGIYTRAGAKIWTLGSTVQATTNTLQSGAMTSPPTLQPGGYYIALANDTGGVNTTVFANVSGQLGFTIACGVKQMATAFPLPATLTPAQAANDFIPMFGFTGRSLI